MKRRLLVAGVVSALGFVMSAAMTGVAWAATAPRLVAPANGSSFEADTPPAFSVTDSPPSPLAQSVYVNISRSPAVDSDGLIGNDVEAAEMSSGGGDTWTWTPPPVTREATYPWEPGTYYWQAFHIDCTSPDRCDVASTVSQFTITAVPAAPAPQPIQPADNAVAQTGSTVEFSASDPVLEMPAAITIWSPNESSTTIPAYGYGVDGHTSYYRAQMPAQAEVLRWAPSQPGCGPSNACGSVTGPIRTLRVIAPSPPPANKKPRPRGVRCRHGFTKAEIAGRAVCLHPGEFCAPRYTRQYQQRHFMCVRVQTRFRLEKRVLPSVPIWDGANAARGLQRRPRVIVYTGDGTGAVGGAHRHQHGTLYERRWGRLRWTTWARTEARGVGANWDDNCSPSCANGQRTPYPVRVHLHNPAWVHGHWIFTKMTLTYTRARPAYPHRRTLTMTASYHHGEYGWS